MSTQETIQKFVRYHLRKPAAADKPLRMTFVRTRDHKTAKVTIGRWHRGTYVLQATGAIPAGTIRVDNVVQPNERTLVDFILAALTYPEEYQFYGGEVDGRYVGTRESKINLSAKSVRKYKFAAARSKEQRETMEGRKGLHVPTNLQWEDPVTYEPVPKTNAYYIRQNAIDRRYVMKPSIKHVYSKNTLLRLLQRGGRSPMTRAEFEAANIFPVPLSKAERRAAKIARRAARR